MYIRVCVCARVTTMFDNIKKVGLYFILKDNPRDLFLLIFWGGMTS